MGIGDRFAHQGKAQLAAFIKAKQLGVDVAPVWNKSNREHLIVHSEPPTVRAEADAAVKALNWKDPYFVDADHIGVKTVDRFVAASNFFTLDVADFIAKPAGDDDIKAFVSAQAKYAPFHPSAFTAASASSRTLVGSLWTMLCSRLDLFQTGVTSTPSCFAFTKAASCALPWCANRSPMPMENFGRFISGSLSVCHVG